MSHELDVSTEEAKQKRASKKIHIPRKRLLRFITVAYLPLILLLTVSCSLLLNLVAFNDPPSYIADVREYVVTGRVTLTLAILMSAQAIATWIMSLWAAGSGAKRCSRPAGQWLTLRLKVISQKLRKAVYAVVILRLLLMFAIGGVAALAFTTWFGQSFFRETSSDIATALRMRPLYVFFFMAVMLAQGFLGPFLRMRYSAALGALTATWTKNRYDRAWVAISVKLMISTLGILVLLWGLQISSSVYFALVDPIELFERYALPYGIHPFSRLPFDTAQILLISSVTTGVLLLNLFGQIVLPPIILWFTQRRLASTNLETS